MDAFTIIFWSPAMINIITVWWYFVLLIILIMAPLLYLLCPCMVYGSDKRRYEKVLRYITAHGKAWCHSANDKNIPIGIVFGRRFLALIHEEKTPSQRGDQVTTYTIKCIGRIPEDDEEKPLLVNNALPKSRMIQVGGQTDGYLNGPFRQLSMLPIGNEETKAQKEIVERIIENATDSKYNGFVFGCTVFLHGPKGTGKTHTAKLLAYYLNNATYICTHDPFEFGGTLDSITMSMKCSPESPIVILLDEFDDQIKQLLGIVQSRLDSRPIEYLHRPLHDKRTVNAYFDRISEIDGLFVVITSNTPYDELTKLLEDKEHTCLRKGRINLVYELNEQVAEEFAEKRLRPRPKEIVCPYLRKKKPFGHVLRSGVGNESDEQMESV
jgi:hypothetical protein